MEKNNSLPSRVLALLPVALLCAMFLVAPMVPDIKLIRPKLLTLQMGIFGALTLWLMLATLRGALVLRGARMLAPVGAYLALGAAFYALSPDRPVALMEFNRCILSVCAYLAALQIPRAAGSLRWVLGAWMGGTFFAVLYGILQHCGGIGRLAVPQMDRVMSLFGNPIFFAAHLVISLPIAFGLLMSGDGDGRRGWLARSALWAVIGAGLWALLLTKTRGAFLGLIAAVVVLAVLRLRRGTEDGRRAAPPGLSLRTVGYALAVLAVAGMFAAATWSLWSRQQAHLLIWRDTVAMWTAHPWFGTGSGTFHLYFPHYASDVLKSIWPQGQCIVNDAHNEYLQILSETGILGLGVFLWLMAAFFIRRARLAERGQGFLADALTAGAAGLLAMNAVSVDMRFIISSVYLFTVFGLVDGMTAPEREMPLAGAGKKMAVLIVAAAAGYGLFTLALTPFLAQRKVAATPDFFDQKILEPAKTAADLEALAQKYPNESSIREKLGWIYAKEKQWDRAVANYQEAQRLNPQAPGPYNNLGNIFFLTGNRDGAIACWQESLAVAPTQIDSRLNLATAYYYQGRLKEAADELKTVLKINPGNEKAIVLLKQMTE